MKKKYFLLVLAFFLGVGAILSLSVSELVGQKPPSELSELTVIVRESDSSIWSAARQGMEQAAVDFGAELRFLTLTTQNSVTEQRVLLGRELASGARGVILAPANPVEISQELQKAAGQAAILTLETDMSGSGAVDLIAPDNRLLGEALARSAIEDLPAGSEILLVSSALPETGIDQRLQAAEAMLAAAGYIPSVGILSPNLLAMAEGMKAILTFEPYALEQALQQLPNKGVPLLYGVGSTGLIMAGLEQGTVTAIAAQNEFATGYTAVQEAVWAIERRVQKPREPMEFKIIRKRDMYQMENQKLLFPVTR